MEKEKTISGWIRDRRFSLRGKMILLISLLIAAVSLLFASLLYDLISDTIEDQVGKRALSIAHSVAEIPELQDAFALEDPGAVIQDIVTPILEKTEAEFIVVGNREGIRYSHPDPEKIGGEMVGGDNERALRFGESYISKKRGTLGLSIRGKVPVYHEGEIVGVVSVGILNDSVQTTIEQRARSLWLTLGLVLLIGIIGAVAISNYIKQLLGNKEPEEISDLYTRQEAILQSTHEGILATDAEGRITLINTAASEILNGSPEAIRGGSVHRLLPPNTDLGQAYRGREMVLGNQTVLANQIPISGSGTYAGSVITFQRKSEIQKMTEELSRIRQYANAQRAQTHEHSNKMHIILGLLMNGRPDEAIDYIRKENNAQHSQLKFLEDRLSDPLIQALLQGKQIRAVELGVTLSINPDSRLSHELSEVRQDALLTALGNVIENAFDAVRGKADGKRAVSVYFTDLGNDVLFEVEDTGGGVAPGSFRHLFEQGFSTKNGEGRGIGLALSRQSLTEVGGEITYEEGEAGACFIISIPKEEVEKS
ncbi:histidine kinase [Bhargavaea cecembensis]|uniref:histidine kinase n=1 Tax=Bhargavaea cecembensis TaxID=394098 RepID=A0A165GSU4_9BACL|nr:sensor histidine kinase [Bhargavaea cecembensis]KZE37534.1 histidine kinase [Bhargavaea cecembensis]